MASAALTGAVVLVCALFLHHSSVLVNSAQCRASALLIKNCSEVYECSDGTLCCKHSNGSFECTCQGLVQITAECECPIGFEQNDSLCYNVDECASDTSNCDPNTDCLDNDGSFECICRNGFRGNGTSCLNIDECTENLNNCSEHAHCMDTDGSFQCRCNLGFSDVNGDGTTCIGSIQIDVNECTAGSHTCDVNAVCINTVDSFDCTCQEGFDGDGTICANIDECVEELNNCSEHAHCMDTEGGFRCRCNLGFRDISVNQDGTNCTDIDECTTDLYTCHVNADCVNTNGSFDCTCRKGYAGDGRDCNNVNECVRAEANNCHSSALCSDTIGSFECVCRDGYEGDGVKCTNIDECESRTSNCSEYAECQDTDGSFLCKCLIGFSGDGTSCVDIDECKMDSVNCINSECRNLAGSFDCDCKPGYSKDSSALSDMEIRNPVLECTNVDECQLGTHNCSDHTYCNDTIGGFLCACIDGFQGDGIDCSDPTTEENTKSSTPLSIIAGAVGGGVAVLIFVTLMTVLVVRIMRKSSSQNSQQTAFHNPVYSRGSQVIDIHVPVVLYEPQYEMAGNTHGTAVHEYEEPEVTSSRQQNHTYYNLEPQYQMSNSLDSYVSGDIAWGVFVPTENERNTLTRLNQDIYAALKESQSGSIKSDTSFFEESDTYWKPATDCSEIYQQMARNKYREIPRHLIQITEHLGDGQFGTVSKAILQAPSGVIDVAVKMLQPGAAEEDAVKFLQEAAINGQFRHPNIVRLMGVVTIGNPVMIITEYMINSDLKNYLRKKKPVPGELVSSDLPEVLLAFCQQIAAGMEHLSMKSFVHRDLAARNILVDGNRICKITDFGLSRDLEDSSYYISGGGKIPVKWTAPEALHYKMYSTASDVWSYGVVMYEIWSLGCKPFQEFTNMEAMKLVNSGYRLPPPPGCPRKIYRTMISCWHPETRSRPTFATLLRTLGDSGSQLLGWSNCEENRELLIHPQATTLGASLEAGKNLYTDLQSTYIMVD